MAQDLSTAGLEYLIYELTNALSNSDWNDTVKDSYYEFIKEEELLISEVKWLASKANSIYNNAVSIDIGKFKSTYGECVAQLQRLQMGE